MKSVDDNSQYICDFCGEEIVVPVDISAGANQDYVEDCPVCCNPNRIVVVVDSDGQVEIRGEAIQDHS